MSKFDQNILKQFLNQSLFFTNCINKILNIQIQQIGV